MQNQNNKIKGMKKLSKKEQKETEILANRIMPKTDFQKVIEHDKVYYNTMNQALEFNIIKQDILEKECKKILQKQSRELIIEKVDTLVDWAETQVKVLDLKGKLRIQQKLVEDKEMHFENIFLPQFEKEVKEAKKNVDATIERAREFCNSDREGVESIKAKLTFELSWWDKCSVEKQRNDEYILQVYKPLNRLLNAYDNDKNK